MTSIALQQAQDDFLQNINQAWQQQTFERLIISQILTDAEQNTLAEVQKMILRPVILKNQLQLSVLYRYATKDITKNYTWDEAERLLMDWIQQAEQFNLWTHDQEIQLKFKKKQWKLTQSKIKASAEQKIQQKNPVAQTHDRSKKRWIEQDRKFLQLLGITDQQHQIIPSMARKWKQINKFVEIFAGAVAQADFNQYRSSDEHSDSYSDQSALHVVDFGSGKGYLTSAIYDYLQSQEFQPEVTGVELRAELVSFCQTLARQSGFEQLKFFQGDVRTYQPAKTDVMIALHACDIATDFAIHTGIRLGAKVVMCSPCCHKELRPQLSSPSTLQPMLQYGLHAGQQAEMLTDTLRALFLQAYGYETKVLEFISLEHTSKNKMILAIKRDQHQQVDTQILKQIADLKNFYGIKHQTLESLLNDQPVDQNVGCAC